MKVSDIHELLRYYPKTNVSGKSLGCQEEIIRTTTVPDGLGTVCEGKDLVETHWSQIEDFINSNTGKTIYVRVLPSLSQLLDNEGDINGYTLVTRIQCGETGKCITQEQYDHLVEYGVI